MVVSRNKYIFLYFQVQKGPIKEMKRKEEIRIWIFVDIEKMSASTRGLGMRYEKNCNVFCLLVSRNYFTS